MFDLRNSPLKKRLSPSSKHLLGRGLRFVLPTTKTRLLPATIDIDQLCLRHIHIHKKQNSAYDKNANNLKAISLRQTVHIKDKTIIVTDKYYARSFIVQTPSGGSYQRNRRHLIKTVDKGDANPIPGSLIRNVFSNDDTVTDDKKAKEVHLKVERHLKKLKARVILQTLVS